MSGPRVRRRVGPSNRSTRRTSGSREHQIGVDYRGSYASQRAARLRSRPRGRGRPAPSCASRRAPVSCPMAPDLAPEGGPRKSRSCLAPFSRRTFSLAQDFQRVPHEIRLMFEVVSCEGGTSGEFNACGRLPISAVPAARATRPNSVNASEVAISQVTRCVRSRPCRSLSAWKRGSASACAQRMTPEGEQRWLPSVSNTTKRRPRPTAERVGPSRRAESAGCIRIVACWFCCPAARAVPPLSSANGKSSLQLRPHAEAHRSWAGKGPDASLTATAQP
jgi:hypothetical protein